MVVFGLQHISRFLENKDTEFIQKELTKVARNLPDTICKRRDFVAYEHKEGFGTIFTNFNKTHEKAPAMTGSIMHKGEVIRLGIWENTSSNGQTYWSVRVSQPSPEGGNKPTKPQYPKEVSPFEDDVPF